MSHLPLSGHSSLKQSPTWLQFRSRGKSTSCRISRWFSLPNQCQAWSKARTTTASAGQGAEPHWYQGAVAAKSKAETGGPTGARRGATPRRYAGSFVARSMREP